MAFRYGAKGWNMERRLVARIEATAKGLDVRYVVTSLKAGAKHLKPRGHLNAGTSERRLTNVL
jgi:hypothetical protein